MCDFIKECETSGCACLAFGGPLYEKPDCLKEVKSQEKSEAVVPLNDLLAGVVRVDKMSHSTKLIIGNVVVRDWWSNPEAQKEADNMAGLIRDALKHALTS